MRLLLDTHIAIWALTNDRRLGIAARRLIMSEDNSIWISVATVWEIAVKHALGRAGKVPFSGIRALAEFRAAGFRLLDVTAEHAAGVELLPLLHADPFDRLLVAQSLAEPLRLLTADARVAAYGDTVMLV